MCVCVGGGGGVRMCVGGRLHVWAFLNVHVCGGERMRMQNPKQLENHLLNFQTKHYDICLPIPVSTSNKRLLWHNSAVHAITYIYMCEYITHVLQYMYFTRDPGLGLLPTMYVDSGTFLIKTPLGQIKVSYIKSLISMVVKYDIYKHIKCVRWVTRQYQRNKTFSGISVTGTESSLGLRGEKFISTLHLFLQLH